MTEEKLRSMIQTAMNHRLSGLREKPDLARQIVSAAKGETITKRKLPLAAVLALILLCVTAIAYAAANWNVLSFLFAQDQQEQAAPFVQPVHAESTDGQVTLTIDSALCDGEYLAFDWTISNSQPEKAVYPYVEQFTANGVRLWTDGTDEFDQVWLTEGWEDGTFTELPEELKNTEHLDVTLIVGVYQPTVPVYVLSGTDERYPLGFDPKLALQKIEEGYLVRDGFDGWVIRDDKAEDGISVISGFHPQESDPFARTELALHFTLDVSAARAASVPLTPREEYRMDTFTARYQRAVITPIGIYLDLLLTPNDSENESAYDALYAGDARPMLTDGQGKPLKDDWPLTGESHGFDPREIHMLFPGVGVENLPDTIALSFVRQDGSGTANAVFPIEISL